MQAKSNTVSMILVSALILVVAAMAASFAASVHGADRYASRYQETSNGRVVIETGDFDYFPSHYVNQATEIEELPATF